MLAYSYLVENHDLKKHFVPDTSFPYFLWGYGEPKRGLGR